MSRVVIWSGGLDSTLLLTHELAHNSPGTVRALTIIGPDQLPKEQRRRERIARREFKTWAKSCGWQIDHQEICIKTKAQVTPEVGQSGLWLCHTMPYINPGDVALFGYIRGDDFWHMRSYFVNAFNTVALSHRAHTASIEFPFEWYRKKDIVAGAKAYRIPGRCWWTCEGRDGESKRSRACGRCDKCRQLRRAKEDLREHGMSGPAYEIAPPPPGSLWKKDLMTDREMSLVGDMEKAIDDSDRDDEDEGVPMAEFFYAG